MVDRNSRVVAPRVSGRGGREISLDLISQAPGCIAVRPVQGVRGHFRKHTIILYSHLMKICVECFDPGHLGQAGQRYIPALEI